MNKKTIKSKTSRNSKATKALLEGNILTPAQIRARYKLANPYDVAYRMRKNGHCVYTNPRELVTGKQTSEYVIGQPSKDMVALAHAWVGARAFS